MRRGQRLIEGRHDSMGRGAGAKMRWPRMPQVSSGGVPGQMGWVSKDRVWVVGGRVMLRRHSVVRWVGRGVVERGWPRMLERAPVVVMVRIIRVRSLGLFPRMRLLRRVVDIVVGSHTVVARQRVSNTWIPPERAALAGCRTLNRNSLLRTGPRGAK